MSQVVMLCDKLSLAGYKCLNVLCCLDD